MKVAIMAGLKEVKIIEKDVPKPKNNEALIKVEYVGICGSDLHYYESGRIGDYEVTFPFVLGHECSGTVVQIGRDVKNLAVGDRVTLEPGKTCGKCDFCKSGKYNLCKDVIFFATPPVDGVLQEYVTHDSDLCFKLPDSISMLEGAMIEPLSIGFHAANQGEAEIGQTAVVFGAGCIGLSSLLALKAKGLSRVIVIDILQNRLKKAKELGASEVMDPGTEDVLQQINELTNGEGCDLIIETTGHEGSIASAIKLAKKGANIVFVGYSASGMANINLSLALDKELTFKTVFRYRNIYKMAIDAVASGLISVKEIVTDIFDFDDIDVALDQSINNKAEIVKAAVRIGKEENS